MRDLILQLSKSSIYSTKPSIGRPNPGLALVSFLMMMILANGEKIITGFLDAGVVL
ncbi:hypothetical protein RA189_26775 (plasmid) [Klebsiella pneumoniae]|nr:hypothetical protein [Klebsiella pneumoniae]WLX18236.1 hypothetical protein RA189_26775 [Klebsiella pneumoniae]